MTVPVLSKERAPAAVQAAVAERRAIQANLLELVGSFGKRLVVDDVRRQQLTVEILRAALDWCASGPPAGGGPVPGCEPNARADLANAIRPGTLT